MHADSVQRGDSLSGATPRFFLAVTAAGSGEPVADAVTLFDVDDDQDAVGLEAVDEGVES